MAIKYLGSNRIEGLTTDIKPTSVPTGSRFYETDANYGEWFFDGISWIERLSLEADVFYDDFSSGTFTFASDGAISPNGLWKNRFRGGGSSGVRVSSGGLLNGINVQWITPQVATSSGQTFSGENYPLNETFQDFELTCKMRTVAQLRTGSAPNSWETAWLLWRMGDISGGQMGYYFTIKMTGCEFGKSDNKEGSIFNVALATPGSPTCTIGQWYAVKIRVQGNRHQMYVDTTGAGRNYTLVIDYTDTDVSLAAAPSRQIQKGGYITTYCEDANVEFADFRIMPIYPKSVIDYEQSVYNTVPLPSGNRKFGAWYASGVTAADGLLNGILTSVGASNAQTIDDLGIYWGWTTGTVSGNQAGLSTTLAQFRRTHNVTLRAKVKTPATLANSQFWIGFSSSGTVGTGTDPLNTFHGVLVGFRSGATQWQILSNNGSATDTLTTEGTTLVASKWVNISIDLQSAYQCVVQINNRPVVSLTATTAKPAVSTNMFVHCLLTTTTTAARSFNLNHLDMEISPGIDQ